MGMPRAYSVRQCLGRAAAHLLSSGVSVGGSDVEELGRHSWSEAVRGLVWPADGHFQQPVCDTNAWRLQAGTEVTKALSRAQHCNRDSPDGRLTSGVVPLESHASPRPALNQAEPG